MAKYKSSIKKTSFKTTAGINHKSTECTLVMEICDTHTFTNKNIRHISTEVIA